MEPESLTIGQLSDRTGVATSALRFYEEEGLVHATRTAGGQRRYQRDTLRRVSFIRIAQSVGMTLDQIGEALRGLPDHRTPNKRDWARLSSAWRPVLDERIAMLERMRDQLGDCIGCGCLSLRSCALYNRGDAAAGLGTGPRYLMGDTWLDTITIRNAR